jgi:hypothetical protein
VRMRAIALGPAEMAGALTMLRSIVSSTANLVVGRLPNENFWVEATE